MLASFRGTEPRITLRTQAKRAERRFEGLNTEEDTRGINDWASETRNGRVLSLPVFAFCTLKYSVDSWPCVIFVCMQRCCVGSSYFMVFLRQHLGRQGTLAASGAIRTVDRNLQRLQRQLVQSEKLISLGQLAAGAAHEIKPFDRDPWILRFARGRSAS